jgi:hypothetical protein
MKDFINSNDCNQDIKYNFYKFIKKSFETLNPGREFIEKKHTKLIEMILMKMCWHNMPIEKMKKYYNFSENDEEKTYKQVILNIPPRELKSTICSIIFPAWVLGHSPHIQFLVASSSSRLAKDFLFKTKIIMESEWFKNIFPECIVNKKGNNQEFFRTTQNGFRMGCSLGQNIIGYGADYLIMDDPEDPIKINKQGYRNKTINWFQTVFASRANNRKNSRILLCTARIHNNDLSNKLLDKNFRNDNNQKNNSKIFNNLNLIQTYLKNKSNFKLKKN